MLVGHVLLKNNVDFKSLNYAQDKKLQTEKTQTKQDKRQKEKELISSLDYLSNIQKAKIEQTESSKLIKRYEDSLKKYVIEKYSDGTTKIYSISKGYLVKEYLSDGTEIYYNHNYETNKDNKYVICRQGEYFEAYDKNGTVVILCVKSDEGYNYKEFNAQGRLVFESILNSEFDEISNIVYDKEDGRILSRFYTNESTECVYDNESLSLEDLSKLGIKKDDILRAFGEFSPKMIHKYLVYKKDNYANKITGLGSCSIGYFLCRATDR